MTTYLKWRLVLINRLSKFPTVFSFLLVIMKFDSSIIFSSVFDKSVADYFRDYFIVNREKRDRYFCFIAF